MTTTSISPSGLALLSTNRTTTPTTRPDRETRPVRIIRRIGSFLARQARALSVANETPSDQAMRGLSSVDRPVR